MVTPRVSRQVAKTPSHILPKPPAVASAPIPKPQPKQESRTKATKSLNFMAMAAAIRVLRAKTEAAAQKLEAGRCERVKPNGNRLVRCGRCSALVRPDRLKKHLQKAHKTTSRRTTATNGKSTCHRQGNGQSLNEDFKPVYRGTAEEDKHSKNMDGGKHNYVIRESGRFGSSPSYDSFGDDSDPE